MSKLTISPACGVIVQPLASLLITVSVVSTEGNLVLRSIPAMLGLGLMSGFRNILHFQDGKDQSVLPVWSKVFLSGLLLAIVIYIHLRFNPTNEVIRIALAFLQIGYGANLLGQISLWVFQIVRLRVSQD